MSNLVGSILHVNPVQNLNKNLNFSRGQLLFGVLMEKMTGENSNFVKIKIGENLLTVSSRDNLFSNFHIGSSLMFKVSDVNESSTVLQLMQSESDNRYSPSAIVDHNVKDMSLLLSKNKNIGLIKTNNVLLEKVYHFNDLVKNIKSVLTGSGIFYESHQNDWLSSKVSLSEILKEPQNNNFIKDFSVDKIVEQQVGFLNTQQIKISAFAWPNQKVDWILDNSKNNCIDPLEKSFLYTELEMTTENLGHFKIGVSLFNNNIELSFLIDDGESKEMFKNSFKELFDNLSQKTDMFVSVKRDCVNE